LLLGLFSGVAVLFNIFGTPPPTASISGTSSFNRGYFVVQGPVLTLAA